MQESEDQLSKKVSYGDESKCKTFQSNEKKDQGVAKERKSQKKDQQGDGHQRREKRGHYH